jgi:hypothetical protein
MKLVNDETTPAFLKKWSRDGAIPVKTLPENLIVGGDLIIRGAAALTALPENLQVGGKIVLQGCHELKKLPDKLSLKSDLVIISSPKLRRLPENLKAKRLMLIGCGIEALPDNIEIEEKLHIESCNNLTTLSENLSCLASGRLKWLFIGNSPIKEFPSLISVSVAIKLTQLPLAVLSNTFLSAKSIHITRCANLRWVSALLNLDSQLNFRGCKKLEGFSNPMKKIGALDLTDCESLQALPLQLQFSGAATNQINLTNCGKLMELPNTEFSGRLEISGSPLKSLPLKMSKCRVYWRRHWVPSDVIFNPQNLTPGRILTEPNAEIRRLMLEKVGIEKVLLSAAAAIIDSDHDAGGARSLVQVKLRAGRNANPQNCLFLRCCCPSTGREYLLPVAPNITTCRAAAAWLAGFDNPDDYQPILET